MVTRLILAFIVIAFSRPRPVTIVEGGIILQQIEVVTPGTVTSWPVEGVATYAYGGDNVTHFLFRCTSIINNGTGLTWSRKTGDLTKTPTVAPGGIDLDFGNNSTTSDTGVYVCRDNMSDDIAELNITDRNPAACPVHSGVLHAVIGETVAVEFYASGLPRTQAGNYSWWHNNVNITSGIFEKDKRRLVIPNVQSSDSGEYRFRVLLQFDAIQQLAAFASTQLIVAAPPQITQELPAVTMATEWSSVTLTCTVNSTFALNVVWERVGGALPPTNQSYTNEGVATLIIPVVRFDNIGEYYFNASYTSPATGIKYYAATHTQLSISPVLRLRINNAPLNQFLYQTVGSSFTIRCQGSGQLSWNGPGGTSTNISSFSSSNVYQSTGNLHFSSFNETSNGIYTCSSSLGATEFIMITNVNPSVYSSVTNLRVDINTIATLQVYIGGSDPVPLSGHIHWYKNGSAIIAQTSQYYTLSVDHTQLTINVSNKNIVGVYECRVTTVQGQASSFINVSLPEPPVVQVKPSNRTVLTGNSVSLECLVNGTLPYTIQWLFGSATILPLGVSVLGNTQLVINSANRTHTGSYVCVVSDDINEVMATAVLLVKYPPTAGVGYTTHSSQPSLTISLNILTIPPTVICSSDGYPAPTLTWMFNEDLLPNDVIQTHIELSDGLSHVQLQWLRGLSYQDNGMYMCVAQNELDTSTSLLNIVVIAKPKISTIYPALENMLTFKTNSIIPTFLLNQRNASNTTLICVAHGLPIPNLKWQATSGAKLNASSTTHSDGVVSAVLTMNKLLSVTAVQCVAFSGDTGMDNQTVWIEEVTDSMVQETSVSSYSKILNTKFVARLNQDFLCCDNQSISLTNILQLEINQILHHVVISRINQAANISIDTTSCSREVPGAVVIKGHIETQDPTMSEHVFRSLDEWRRTGPVIFINNSWATLDQNCALQAPDNTSLECMKLMKVPTPTIAVRSYNTAYVLVGVFCCFVLLVFLTCSTVIISYNCQRARNKKATHPVLPLEINMRDYATANKISMEEYATHNKHNTSLSHDDHKERLGIKKAVCNQVLDMTQRQACVPITLEDCLAYTPSQVPEQRPAYNQIFNKKCPACIRTLAAGHSNNQNERFEMVFCTAYVDAQGKHPVNNRYPMEDFPASTKKKINETSQARAQDNNEPEYEEILL